MILALDFGSTGVKVTLFDEYATIIGSRYKEYKTYFPKTNYVMQSPKEWWNAFCEAVRELTETDGFDASQISCVAPSAQMSSAIPIDKDGNVLFDPCWIWADMRATQQVKRICEEFGGEKNLYHITGGGMTQETYTGFKIAWMKENMPDLYKKTVKFLQVKELISWKLTGELATDYSDASECAMMDIKKKVWSKDILRAIGVSEDKLLPIKKATDILGFITKEAAEATGLKEGTPVCVGGGDVSIAAAGAGIANKGECYIYIGSGAWMGVYSNEPMFDYDARMVSLCDISGNGYVPHQLGYCGGIAHKWMRDLVNNMPGIDGKIDYAMMEQMVRESPIGAKGLLFMPFLRGGGAPYNEIDARGCFVGLDLGHTYADLCRSVMEGTAYILREILRKMEKSSNDKMRQVMLIGGGAKSDVWRQILADVLQKEITCTTMTQEANSWGAAICGGVAVGMWKDVRSAQKLLKITSVNKPNFDVAHIYDEIFKTSKLAFDNLLPVYHLLADVRKMLENN